MSTKLTEDRAAMQMVVDGTLADQEWNKTWNRVRQVFNAVVHATNPRDRWKGKHRYRRLLETMATIRRGETELGACTDYRSDMWTRSIAMRRAALQQTQIEPKSLFAEAADIVPKVSDVRPLSQPVLPEEQAAVASGREYFVLWQSPYNHQPLLLPEVPKPGSFVLH